MPEPFKPDTFWRSTPALCSEAIAPWLRDRGSLTQRIQRRCQHFEVLEVRSSLCCIAREEALLLGVAARRLAWSREVFLYADGVPVIYAHSACARRHLRGAWQALSGLGDRPLGALLFSHPQVERRPLHYKALGRTHPLCRQALAKLEGAPDKLWARRSLFILHEAPLLVTEVFLPGIVKLVPCPANIFGRDTPNSRSCRVRLGTRFDDSIEIIRRSG